MKIKLKLRKFLRCNHKNLTYRSAGGKGCPYNEDSGDCSIPVYELVCHDCNTVWLLGEDEVIDFFCVRREEIE